MLSFDLASYVSIAYTLASIRIGTLLLASSIVLRHEYPYNYFSKSCSLGLNV